MLAGPFYFPEQQLSCRSQRERSVFGLTQPQPKSVKRHQVRRASKVTVELGRSKSRRVCGGLFPDNVSASPMAKPWVEDAGERALLIRSARQ